MKILTIAVVILSIFIILLFLYIAILQSQIYSINRQLTKRLTEHTRQPVSLELISRSLNTLAVNINKCLKAEENLRLDSIREEKHFKEMIANISHDLRTPLTAIKGYQQLMEKGSLSNDQRNKLKIAQNHADELGDLIERFFEYSYLLNAELKPKAEKINLTNLTAECLAESVAVFEENNMEVCFDDMTPVFAYVDNEMTVRIIRNLIRNCIQHSAGNIKVLVFRGKEAVISFRNPVKEPIKIDVKRIFDRFYTMDQASGRSTGLGLSIVKLLAEQMGGEAYAELQGNYIDICIKLPLWDNNDNDIKRGINDECNQNNRS